MRKYPWLHRPISSLFTHSCTLPGRPEVVGMLPTEWNTANKTQLPCEEAKEGGCSHRMRAVKGILPPPHFLTRSPSGRDTTAALKLITPSPAAIMPQGQDVIHSTQRKQSLRHKSCHCSPTLPKTLTTTISVGYENYWTLVAVNSS